jgi:hypothetical protein
MIIFILTSLCISLVGCEQKGINETETDSTSLSTFENYDYIYDITNEVYTMPNVTINYPQIVDLANKNLQNTINELIKNEALFNFKEDVDENLELQLDYDIELKSVDVLSIKYTGLGYYKDASYPNKWYFTTNIDLRSGSIIKLLNLFKIDDKFVSAFKNGNYITDSNKELKDAVIDYVNSMDTENLIQYFNQADNRKSEENPANVFSYFTEDSVVIIIGVPHALGDHAEIELKYLDLDDNLNNNELWNKLMNP